MTEVLRVHYTFNDYCNWQNLRFRLEHQFLNSMLISTTAAFASVAFYRYTTPSGPISQQINLIDASLILFSVYLVFCASVSRYVGQFIFLHSCPDIVQSNKDLDELLKKARETIVDTGLWDELHADQVGMWNFQIYRRPLLRRVIGLSELLILVFYAVGLVLFLAAVYPLVRQSLIGYFR